MITRSRNPKRESIQLVKMLQFMIDEDVHRFIIGTETGLKGYQHWQVRIKIRNLTEDEKKDYKFLKTNFGESAHIELCSDTWHYERKDGIYYDEGDFNLARIGRLQTRMGDYLQWQETYLKLVSTQNDRQIDVAYDPQGNKGKSWLVSALFERGQAHYVPPYCTSIEKIVQTIASLYLKQGWRDYIIIDIPRAYKWSEQIYTAIESIKDGVIMETRYEAQPINIKGVKIIIMCNDAPKVNKLSADRWRISTLS